MKKRMQKPSFHHIAELKNIFAVTLLSWVAVSCSFGPDREGTLIISGGNKTWNEASLTMSVQTDDLSYLSEDNLLRFEQLMLHELSADSLHAAQQQSIERFVSLGGQLYFWQVDMQYRHKWPLLEKFISQEDESDTKAGNSLASRRDEIRSFTYGAGNVYYLSDIPYHSTKNSESFLIFR